MAVGATLTLVDALQLFNGPLAIAYLDENARFTVLFDAIDWLGIEKFKSYATFVTNVYMLLNEIFRLVIWNELSTILTIIQGTITFNICII
jgi:hypothetical protein